MVVCSGHCKATIRKSLWGTRWICPKSIPKEGSQLRVLGGWGWRKGRIRSGKWLNSATRCSSRTTSQQCRALWLRVQQTSNVRLWWMTILTIACRHWSSRQWMSVKARKMDSTKQSSCPKMPSEGWSSSKKRNCWPDSSMKYRSIRANSAKVCEKQCKYLNLES